MVELGPCVAVGSGGFGSVVVVGVGDEVGDGLVGVGRGVVVVGVGGCGGACVADGVVDDELRVVDASSLVLEVSELVVPVIGGPGGIGGAVVYEVALLRVVVGRRVMSGPADSRLSDPATTAAVVAKIVATAMPDAASITRRFGRASGSSTSNGSIGAPTRVGSSSSPAVTGSRRDLADHTGSRIGLDQLPVM
ncbi:hypothetical protein [Saccharopolyspora aridisoli]|uniref:hypothetical protein n=1 Tax=Saccharopolyspora aridisoli TaxID=2530385 RepID=UPI00140446FF|nr:hypothetical protein [Saccharopolyspora aridisoli]